MEKMKCSPNEMAFTGCLVHTLRCTEMQVPKNLGCCGAELQFFEIIDFYLKITFSAHVTDDSILFTVIAGLCKQGHLLLCSSIV